MIIDAHVHTTGRERPDEVLRAFDAAGVDVAVLHAPGARSEGLSLDDPDSLRRGNEHLSQLVLGHEDRLIGFAVIDPRDPQAASDLRHAVETLGLRGCKMVPTGWYPHDEGVQPVFATVRELGIPLLLHSGMCLDGRSSNFCRPAFFEALRAHPGLKVALTHLGWPWTDEALALGQAELLAQVPAAQCMFRFDLSFGAPPARRREVLQKALQVLGPGLLQFGSNCALPCSGACIAERIGWMRSLLDELEVPRADREQIWSGTAAAWLGLGTSSQPARREDTFTAPAFALRSHHRQLHPLADCTRAARTLPDPFSPLSF